jgi:hypothetical protein
VTRDDLELVCGREGLTRPQTAAVLDAADRYATAQARHAIDALGYALPGDAPAVMHLLDVRSGSFTACGQPGVNTTRRGDVTCGTCLAVA